MTDYTDRLSLAYEDAVLTFERRDNFISDDDVLGIAERWSVERDADGSEDHILLRDDLFALLTRQD